MTRQPAPAEDRFWRNVDRSAGEDACWPWLASRVAQGYGRFSVNAGKHIYAHRFAWTLQNGSIPSGLFIIHSCARPECVNPRHLTAGTRGDKANGPRRQPVASRFWEKVKTGLPDDCWEWQGCRDKLGYGRISRGGLMTTVGAHRVAWEIGNKRPVPDGAVIHHRCDNPPCVNPAHLEAVTQAVNVREAQRKGRMQAGEARHNVKLTCELVRKIRALHAGGISQQQLARSFGVNQNTVWKAVNRVTWRSVA